jgi:phosphatidylserine/phosphatidylglycerophosphate/cardiolipin synthase-like enzyme
MNKKKLLCLFLVSLLPIIGCSTSTLAANKPVAHQLSANASTNGISYYFSQENQQPDVQLINVINSANNTLDIAIYSITKPNIVNAIIAAENRGVSVRIITDKIESNTASESQELSALQNAGIPIEINTHSGLMHMKVTIADNSIVTTGSYNYTNNATYENDEVLLVINNPTIAQNWDTEFNNMWNDTTRFTSY